MRQVMSAILLLAGAYALAAGTADDLRALTGGKEMRIVWMREDGGSDSWPRFDGWGQYRLMAYDTRDGVERDVLGNSVRRWRPKISPDGRLLAYDTQSDLYLVNWDGSDNRLFRGGAQMGTFWYGNGQRYLFCFTNGGIARIDIDNPDDVTMVYTGDTHKDYLSISADGTRLGGERERCNHGILNLENGQWTRYHNDECWPSITPDNTYRFLVFNSPHRGWKVFSSPYNVSNLLSLNDDVRFDGTEVYHPRFSYNDVSIISVTGPYPGGLMNGGLSAEVAVGKVNESLTSVEQWVFVTNNTHADFYPYVWIDTEGASQSLGVSTENLAVVCTEGQLCEAVGTVTVSNVTGEPAVSESSSWLSVTTTGTGSTRTLSHDIDASSLGAGVYTATVNVSDGSGASVSYEVSATIQAATLSVATIAISPTEPRIEPEQSLQLTAELTDAAGAPVAAAVEWSVSGGGTLTAGDSGVVAAQHTATFGSDGSRGTYTITVDCGDTSASVDVVVEEVYTALVLTGPTAGSSVFIGQTITFTWDAFGHAHNSTLIEASPDDGESWTTLCRGGGIAPEDTNWQAFNWVVPDSLSLEGGIKVALESRSLLVRVRGYYLTEVMDVIEAPLLVGSSSVYGFSTPRKPRLRVRIDRMGRLQVRGLRGTQGSISLYNPRGALCLRAAVTVDGVVPHTRRLTPGRYIVHLRDRQGTLLTKSVVLGGIE